MTNNHFMVNIKQKHYKHHSRGRWIKVLVKFNNTFLNYNP